MTELLFKYFRGEATTEEIELIGKWLESDAAANGKQFKAARFIYECSVIHCKNHARRRFYRWRTQGWKTVAKYAAAAVAAILLAAATAYTIRTRTYNSLAAMSATFETPIGQQARMSLPDGTQVWLNAGTHMEYPVVFAKEERRVRLSGEAMFDVAHDPKHPFIVETFASEVEALGTKFNVLAEPEANKFSTTLLHGTVKVTRLDDSTDFIVMSPDQTVRLIGGLLKLEKHDEPDELCWMEGQVCFRGLSFAELMAAFEKAFGVDIIIERENIPAAHYSYGKVRITDGIEHALQVLQHSLDFQFVKNESDNSITIR